MECFLTTCKNGGICSVIENEISCECLLGFDGDLCEHNIDDCVNNLCTNGSSCIDEVDEYSCTCASGFTGGHCEISKNSL